MLPPGVCARPSQLRVAPARPARALPALPSPPRQRHGAGTRARRPTLTRPRLGSPGSVQRPTPPDCRAGASPRSRTSSLPPPPTSPFAAAGTSGGAEQKEAPRPHLLALRRTPRPLPRHSAPGDLSPHHSLLPRVPSRRSPLPCARPDSTVHHEVDVQPHGPVLCPQVERAVGWPASPWAPALGSPPGHGVLGTAQVTGLRRHPADIRPRFLLASQASSPVLGSELTPTARVLTGPQPTQPPFRVCAQPGPLATRGPRPRPVPSPFVPPLSGCAPPASPRATRGRTRRTLAS